MKLGPQLEIGMKRSHWSALVNMFKFNPEKHLFQCWLKYILTMYVKHLTFTIYIYKSHISILHGMTLAVMEIVLTIISWLLSLFDSKGQPIVIMFVMS